MTSPMNIKFTCSAGEDLFANSSITNQIIKHFGTSILDSINRGNAGMNLTVFVSSATGIKFNEDDEYQCCIYDKVYSSSGIIYPKHLYVQNAVSGTLSIQVQ